MAAILIKPNQLRSTAQSFIQKAKSIQNAINAVEKDINDLNSMVYMGNRASSLKSHYARVKNELLSSSILIQNFAKELQEIASVFDKADNNQNNLQPLPIITPAPIKKPLINGPIKINDPKDPSIGIILKQGDYLDKMGDNGKTIKQSGCLITDVAMIARYFGLDVNSADVNNFLKTHDGYTTGTSNLKWDVAAQFINEQAGTHGSFGNISADAAQSTLNSGQPVILHINGDTSDGHWVLAIPGSGGNGTFSVMDPATGKERIIAATEVINAKVFTASK
jgi:uncharacterized protein YukE